MWFHITAEVHHNDMDPSDKHLGIAAVPYRHIIMPSALRGQSVEHHQSSHGAEGKEEFHRFLKSDSTWTEHVKGPKSKAAYVNGTV